MQDFQWTGPMNWIRKLEMDDGYFVLMMDMKGTLFEYEYVF